MIKKIILFSFSAIILNAQQIAPVFQIGYDFGGDNLVFTNFDDEINAGDGVFIEGGIAFETTFTSTQLLFGYKLDSIDTDLGAIDMQRTMLSFIQLYYFDRISIGGGATYHINPMLRDEASFRASGVIEDDFDNSLGAVFQLGIDVVPNLNVGLKATLIDYDFTYGNGSVNANSVGFYLNYKFIMPQYY